MKEPNVENKIDFFDDNLPQQDRADKIYGMFQVVSTAPTKEPKSFYDQVQIYTSGSTYRLYWYDHLAHVWHYVTATA